MPPWQDFGLQRSVLQLVLFGSVGYVHAPLLGLHVPGEVWHGVGEVQVTAVPPAHMPDWQVSPIVHAFPSSQPVVSGFAGVEQTPGVALQRPTLWHWSEAEQVPGVQAPAEQVAHPVHAVPVFCQAPLGSQVWGCCPLHFTAPGVQMPLQAPALHTKAHAATPAVFTQLPVASQVCG